MKYIFFICIAFVAVFFFARFLFSPQETDTGTTGDFSDLEKYFGALAESKSERPFLIVALSDTADFFQFTYDSSGVFQIDFPLITERQKSLEERVKSAHQSLGLKFEIVEGSDGSRFIDAYKKANAKEISEIVTSLFEHVYLANQSRKLNFEWDGFDLPEPANQSLKGTK